MAEQAPAPLPYSYRATLFRPERMFTLVPDGLVVTGGKRGESFAYRDVSRVRLHQTYHQQIGLFERCTVTARGRMVVLQSAHVAGMADVTDLRSAYEPFVWALVQRIAEANPAVPVWVGMPWHGRAGWLLVLVLLVMTGLGGLAMVASGAWDGLWLVGTALATAPLAVAMLGKKPSHQIGLGRISSSRGYRDLIR